MNTSRALQRSQPGSDRWKPEGDRSKFEFDWGDHADTGYTLQEPCQLEIANFSKYFSTPKNPPRKTAPPATPYRRLPRHANNAQSNPTPATPSPANSTRSTQRGLSSLLHFFDDRLCCGIDGVFLRTESRIPRSAASGRDPICASPRTIPTRHRDRIRLPCA